MKTRFMLLVLSLLAISFDAFAAPSRYTQLVVRTTQGTVAACESSDSAGDICVGGDIWLDGSFRQTVQTIAAVTTLTTASCGKVIFVTAGIDTASITLPATSAGCELTFVYTGADGGALLDISPNAADGIHGNCTLAASILTFSGTDDADIGLTKATGLTSDGLTLVGDGSIGWFVKGCQGIWANN